MLTKCTITLIYSWLGDVFETRDVLIRLIYYSIIVHDDHVQL